MAQRHAGELRIDSEVGKGSRFTLLFPAARLRGGGDASPRPVDGEQQAWPALRVVK